MSKFFFLCPHCGHQVKAQDDWVGLEAQCPHCGHSIAITKPDGAPAPAPAAVRPETQEEKQCPFCGRMIKKEAVFCKHCKRDLPAVSGSTGPSEPEKTFPYICPDCGTLAELPLSMEGKAYECKGCAESHIATPVTGRKCPYCGEEIKVRATVCKYCRRQVPPLTSGPERKSSGGIFGNSGPAARPMPQTASFCNLFKGRHSAAEILDTAKLFLAWAGCQAVLLILHILSIFVETEALFFVKMLVLTVSAVFFCILYYRYWELVPPAEAATTPGKAVGFLFIPFFQIYWYVFTVWKLSEHYDKVPASPDFGSQAEKMPLTTLVLFCLILDGAEIILFMMMNEWDSLVLKFIYYTVSFNSLFSGFMWMSRIQMRITFVAGKILDSERQFEK